MVSQADEGIIASSMLRIPERLSFAEAAGTFITYPTSYAALVDRGRVVKGETVLVHAGAGGVGLAAIQIAKMLGAIVIATASTPEKLAIMKNSGADYVLNYTDLDPPIKSAPSVLSWIRKTMEITNRKGVDVVFDPVGLISQSIKVAAWNARLIIVGFAGLNPGLSETVTTNRILLKNISLVGLFWGQFRQYEPQRVIQVWNQLTEWFNMGALKPVLYSDQKFIGLASTKDALKCLASRKSYGKIVVHVSQDTQRGAGLLLANIFREM